MAARRRRQRSTNVDAFDSGMTASAQSGPARATGMAAGAPLSFYRRRGKRLLDLGLGLLLFIWVLPVMAAAALTVLLFSGWPVIYRAERLGLNGRPFRMLKLRTMVNGADRMLAGLLQTNPGLEREYQAGLKLRDDPRTTKIGALLRKFSLDELPQLWHVITSEMSLVGPRPYAADEWPLLSARTEVLSVTPGVTGPWQVQGRNELPAEARLRLDAGYTQTITAGRDLRYLLITVKCLVRPNGL